MSILDSLLGGAGYILDTPGALTRGAIGNVADLLEGRDRVGARVGGRELLERLGLAGPNEEGWVPDMGDLAGLGVDVATDPLTYFLPGLTRAVKGAAAGAKAGSTAAKVGAAAATVKSRAAKLAERAGFGNPSSGVGMWTSASSPRARVGRRISDLMGEAKGHFNKVMDKIDPIEFAPGGSGVRNRTAKVMEYMPSMPSLDDIRAGAMAGIDPLVSTANFARRLPGARIAGTQLAEALGRGDDDGDYAEPDNDYDDMRQPMMPEQAAQARILRELGQGVSSMSYDEPDVGSVTVRRKRPPSRAELARRLMAQLELSGGRM